MSTDSDIEKLWPGLRGLTSRMDPVPVMVIAAARESLSWRDPDAALADLVAQPALETADVRGGEGPQLFTFSVADLTIELEADLGARDLQLVGQLVPPQPARITVDHATGSAEVTADEFGRFLAAGIARGPVRLVCALTRQPAHRTVHTAWTLI